MTWPLEHRRDSESFSFKTKAEQRLEWLIEQSRHRVLTTEESHDIERSEHAIYCRARRQKVAA